MKVLLLSVLLLTSMPAWAILPFAHTPAEMAMCNARVFSRLDRSDRKNSIHMHHYCDGLRFIDRALASMSNKREMQYYLGKSLAGFDYVLKATQEDYAMRGEVHVGKARALKLMGRNAEAAMEYQKALRYKLDSPDVYIAVADFFTESGKKTKALEMVTEGLKINPDSRGLKRRYTELGGKLPYPAAEVKTTSAEESKVEDKPEEKPGTEQLPGAAASADADKPTAQSEVIPQIEPPKIGSPTNPYCRFCPD
jgi:tetratricopeptide (TPR) repeat protein